MKKNFLLLVFIFFFTDVSANIKEYIIQNLEKTENLAFNFEQNINGKIENGSCTIQYPKKIFCKYDLGNRKILVSNGRSLVIKTLSSYYIYPIEKTPLNLILDKKYIIKKIKDLNENLIDDKFINFKFIENENEISVFFNQKNYDLIGWQTTDVYQNLSMTFLSSISKNININENIFNLPDQN